MPATKKAQKKAKAARRNSERANQYAEKTGRVVNINVAKARETEVKVIRRKDGLTWLKEKGRISQEQFFTGQWFGEVCMDAMRAGLPGAANEGGGGGTSTASAGPSDWRLIAVGTKRHADSMILDKLPDSGVEMLGLLISVCHEGRTIRDLCGGDQLAGVRMEERLKVGLSLLRYARFTKPNGPKIA